MGRVILGDELLPQDGSLRVLPSLAGAASGSQLAAAHGRSAELLRLPAVSVASHQLPGHPCICRRAHLHGPPAAG